MTHFSQAFFCVESEGENKAPQVICAFQSAASFFPSGWSCPSLLLLLSVVPADKLGILFLPAEMV